MPPFLRQHYTSYAGTGLSLLVSSLPSLQILSARGSFSLFAFAFPPNGFFLSFFLSFCLSTPLFVTAATTSDAKLGESFIGWGGEDSMRFQL